MSDETTQIDSKEWAGLVHGIFARIVDPSAMRYDLSRPFIVGDHLYATNGMILARMPVPAGWTLPNLEHVPKKPWVVLQGEWEPEPVEIPPIEGVCPTCKGTLIQEKSECESCEGTGEIDADDLDCECPHCTGEHECEDCDGTGGFKEGPCSECSGSGVDRPEQSVQMAEGYHIGRRFLAIIQQSGGVAYLPVAPRDDKALRFTIGDVEGCVMPMTGWSEESNP